jgi:hypothetical protein
MFDRRALVRWMAVLSWLVCTLAPLAAGQSPNTPRFGGRFDTLRPEQQQLVRGWFGEYRRVTGKTLAPADAYDEMAPSTRTTFEAVTHALLTTKLTTAGGSSLGTGLDLVQMVEAVHGQLTDARGDHQYRIYVLLKPDAVDRLYKSREFKRTGDNTIFHIGYPVNFRQQGGTPSLQVSVTRTGRRADIDVDYRSSSGPVALFNGHLTSANSDVRAGNNFQRHSGRWTGLRDWWQGLLGLFLPQPEEKVELALGISIPVKPRVTANEPLSAAVHDYFRTWFIDASPETAMSYVSVRSYACLAEFQTGESLESGLAALRILERMRRGLKAYGKTTDLSEVIASVALYPPSSKPVVHDFAQLFSMQHLTDTAARSMDCRVRQRVKLVEPLPYGGDEYGEYYATETRLLKEQGPETVLTQLWTKEEGSWKVISFHLEHPLVGAAPEIVAAEPEAASAEAPSSASQAAIAKASTAFLTAWLRDRRYADAAAYFAPRTAFCADVKDSGSVGAFLASIGDQLPKGASLADLVKAVPFGHPHLRKVTHPEAGAFLLTEVSTDLAKTLECNAAAPDRRSTMGQPTFNGMAFRTDFAIKAAEGEAGAVSLLWRLERNNWRIVAASIIAH